MSVVELHNATDVSSVDDEEDKVLSDGKDCDINDWAEVRLHAFVKEACTVVMLKPSCDCEDR